MKTSAMLFALTSAILAAADNPAGHYVLEGVREVGSELSLKPDGTFEYMLAYGAADYSAKGKWHTEEGAVILNSTIESGPPFRLIRGEAVKTPGTCIWVKAPNGRPVPNIDVVIETPQGKTKERTDSEGAARFSETKTGTAVLFEVRVYQLEAGPYPLNPAHNDFTFEINGPAITSVPFKDERLKINGADLELRFWDKNKPMNYRKQ